MSARRAAVLLVFAAGTASSATVYRCGPDGRSFSQLPCDDGRAIEVRDARSDADRLEGEHAAARQARAAYALERDRLDAGATPSKAVGLDTRPATSADGAERAAPRVKYFRAVDGPTRKKRRRSAG